MQISFAQNPLIIEVVSSFCISGSIYLDLIILLSLRENKNAYLSSWVVFTNGFEKYPPTTWPSAVFIIDIVGPLFKTAVHQELISFIVT